MKKFITAAIIASMLATPVMARDHRRYDNGSRHHHSHRDSNAGGIIAGIIGGVILGAVISEGSRDQRYEDRRDRSYDRYPDERYVVIDRYGSNVYEQRCRINRMVDYYGNVYYEKQCF